MCIKACRSEWNIHVKKNSEDPVFQKAPLIYLKMNRIPHVSLGGGGGGGGGNQSFN